MTGTFYLCEMIFSVLKIIRYLSPHAISFHTARFKRFKNERFKYKININKANGSLLTIHFKIIKASGQFFMVKILDSRENKMHGHKMLNFINGKLIFCSFYSSRLAFSDIDQQRIRLLHQQPLLSKKIYQI